MAYSGAPLPSSDFPTNRRGYDRDAVDGFVRSIQTRLDDLETSGPAADRRERPAATRSQRCRGPGPSRLQQPGRARAGDPAGGRGAGRRPDRPGPAGRRPAAGADRHRDPSSIASARRTSWRPSAIATLERARRPPSPGRRATPHAIYEHARIESEQLLGSARVEAEALLVGERTTQRRPAGDRPGRGQSAGRRRRAGGGVDPASTPRSSGIRR